MNLRERCDAFAVLGATLKSSLKDYQSGKKDELGMLIDKQQNKNQWFTPDNVFSALSAIADELTIDNINHWTSMYPSLEQQSQAESVGVIMAGNIPLVGFHDFLCVLITGNRIVARTSSKDSELIEYIGNALGNINQGFRKMISFTDGVLSGFDKVIATGSNNTSRYFGYYFGRYPNIIRKNRNSIAIIEGDESDEEIKALGSDIFSYFGLGCRNVSKIFIPAGFDLNRLIMNWDSFSGIIFHSKYANNYDYNKAIYLVNRVKFLDPGFMLMKEENGLSSPVSVLYYEYYDSYDAVISETDAIKNRIQCVISKKHIPFGMAQKPHLWDYADGIDTIEFLSKKDS